MKKIFKFNRVAWIGLAFLAALAILLPNKAQLQDQPWAYWDSPPLDDFQKECHPKMESALYKLMKVYLTEGLVGAKEYAQQRKIDMVGDLVRVVLEARLTEGDQEAGIVPAATLVSQQVQSLGGQVETMYRHLVQSIVPFDALHALADFSSVKYFRLPIKPFTQAITSQGVATTKANEWHSVEPYRQTEDVKVCILDAGFKGYEALLGSELPSAVTARSFRADGNIHANQVHGTACAEIVHDMSPNAKLWLVNFNTITEHGNAVNWIVDQGIDIISYSMGWTNAGAGDGTGPICEDLEVATASGVTWVSAAGNEAEQHWEGTFNDPDTDKWHNFSGGDEVLHFYVHAWTPVGVWLNWNDWGTWDGTSYGGSNQDYDLYLYIWDGSDWFFVDSSTGWQTGSQWPTEWIAYWYSSSSTFWAVKIRKYSATRNVKHELFVSGNTGALEFAVPAGSLTIPADSQYAVAVGATDWSDDAYHSYSSRGPTSDVRIKPDLCAPSGVAGSTYGTSSFYGTSASTPHVAGAFALLLEKTPFTLDQIKTILENRAKDLGTSGKDNKFGHGRLNCGVEEE